MSTPLVGTPSFRSCSLLVHSWVIFRVFIEKRKAEAERIRQKYPDRIPVSNNFEFSRARAQSSLCGVH